MNKKRKFKPTIYDIAETAGVSTATVSRTLYGNSDVVAADTRDRILQAATELGYAVRAEKASCESSDYVHVLIPDLVNPFYSTLIAGLESSLRSFNLSMVLHNAGGSYKREIDIVSEIAKIRHANAIISPVTFEVEHISALFNSGHEVVMIERASEDGGCSSICFNSYAGSKMAIEYLVSRGSKRIAFFSPALTRTTRKEIFRGFVDEMARQGLPVEESLLVFAEESVMSTSQYSPDFGVAMCETLLENNQQLPDAICCENDMIAIGVMHCLQQNGIRIPEDVSIIGLDNVAFGAMTTPQLTTIDQCTYELGALAAELIHSQLHSPARKHVQLLLEPQLIKRNSVK